MKVFVFLISVLIWVYTAHSVNLDPKTVEDKFQLFKKSYERHYATIQEEIFRRQIFQNALEQVETHNERFTSGLETYEIGINQFSDLTEEEFLKFSTGLAIPQIQQKTCSSCQLSKNVETPDSFDWRTKGVVNAPKNQGSCGSCWAFSAVGALESHIKIRDGSDTIVSLSEQQLVDCVTLGSKGCNGGWMHAAFDYIAANNSGINYNWDYPYEGKDAKCRFDSAKPHISIKGYKCICSADENLLKQVVATIGPVSVAIDATGIFKCYTKGVYYNPDCGPTHNHAVLIVGYGNENGQDYWLVKNSWGASWGKEGYIKMARNKGNHCGIADYTNWPVL